MKIGVINMFVIKILGILHNVPSKDKFVFVVLYYTAIALFFLSTPNLDINTWFGCFILAFIFVFTIVCTFVAVSFEKSLIRGFFGEEKKDGNRN